jgi:hypothetical protein
MPRIENEPEQAYIERLKRDSGEQAKIARERGTRIHAWVQEGFEGRILIEEGEQFYISAKKELDKECPGVVWECETSFTSYYGDPAYYGCGGKIDLISPEAVVDIKTTEKDLETIRTWDEHAQQLAAYDRGVGRKCGILYINVHTKESRLIWIDPAEIKKGMWCFEALLMYWYAKNGL